MSYVNFNRALTRAEIEALTNATNGKIYFATDGGIYVGNASGTADKKADSDVIWVQIGDTNIDISSIVDEIDKGRIVIGDYYDGEHHIYNCDYCGAELISFVRISSETGKIDCYHVEPASEESDGEGVE